MIKDTDEFKVKSYGWQEFALLYGTDIQPKSAARRLKWWIRLNAELHNSLIKAGWSEGNRLLTPIQVQILVTYLGAP